MATLDERFEQGQEMRAKMADGDPSHFTLPGTDQLAPDLKRIIDEALFGSIWTRPGLELKYRCICTVSALMALGEIPLLRRHIERSLNVGLTPTEVVEVFIQLTFYVGVSATEAALRITKEIFEERGIQFTPVRVYDTNRTTEELYQAGLQAHQKHIGEVTIFPGDATRAVDQRVPLGRHLYQASAGRQGAGYLRSVVDDRPGPV